MTPDVFSSFAVERRRKGGISKRLGDHVTPECGIKKNKSLGVTCQSGGVRKILNTSLQ